MIATARPKIGHVRFLPIDAIRPSPENERLYRPISPEDPEIQDLADSISRHGLQQPIGISADKYIYDGHRRHVAAGVAGLTEVPCRINPIRRSDDPDGFLRLLRECNRQRVKTRAEQLRETVLDVDPEEAYESLIEHRQQQSDVDVVPLNLGAQKKRAEITDAKIPMLKAVEQVFHERIRFLPLSVRQIHYGLLNHPPLKHAGKPDSVYANTVRDYKCLDELLTRARLAGLVPMGWIQDETRPITVWTCHGNVSGFLRREIGGFARGYWRDLMQSQPNHVEVLCEKNTVRKIVEQVTERYCIPTTSGRGYASLPPRQKMADRFERSGKNRLILICVTDHDPEGENIGPVFARSMRDEFDIGLDRIVTIKAALTYDQVTTLNLPEALEAKKSSSRYKGFVAKHGTGCHELEAISPETLQRLVTETIDAVIDREAFNAELDAEKEDAAFLEGVRRRMADVFQDVDLGGHDEEDPE